MPRLVSAKGQTTIERKLSALRKVADFETDENKRGAGSRNRLNAQRQVSNFEKRKAHSKEQADVRSGDEDEEEDHFSAGKEVSFGDEDEDDGDDDDDDDDELIDDDDDDDDEGGGGSDLEDSKKIKKQRRMTEQIAPGESFSQALHVLLSKNAGGASDKSLSKKGHKSKGVVLSQQQNPAIQLEKERFERKLKKQLIEQKRLFKHRHHLSVADFSKAEDERELRKTATKGVVQLFNAIKSQQRKLVGLWSRDKADDSDKQKPKLTKEKFFELLKKKVALAGKGDRQAPLRVAPMKESEEPEQKPARQRRPAMNKQWEVLKDDYILASGKANDQELESEEEDDPREMEEEWELYSDGD